MRRALFIILSILLISSYARGEELFEECERVLNKGAYRLLKEYISKTNEESKLCQRLTDREFLYTDYGNIYYCKAKDVVLSCEQHEEGVRFPDTSVAARFSGRNGKKYILLKTSTLSGGVFGSGYHAFFLVPKTVNERGYDIFQFVGAGEYNGSYSDGGQTCDNIGDSEAVSAMPKPFEIVKETGGNHIVRFNQQITSCKSGEVSRQTLEYTWKEGTFQKTLDKKEAIQAKKKETAQPKTRKAAPTQ